LCWGYRWRADRRKWDKPPCDLTGRTIDGTAPQHWHPFPEALVSYQGSVEGEYRLDGIGLAMASDDTEDALVAVDLDKCRCSETGTVEPWAMAIVERLGTYCELSPSGTGLRLFALGRLAPRGRRRGRVEVYRHGHYLTVTGHRLVGTPECVEQRSEALAWLLAEHIDRPGRSTRAATPEAPPGSLDLDDVELLERAFRAPNGAKLQALLDGSAEGYSSDSEADLATCAILRFWCGNDASRIERIISGSGRGQRPKWRERADYRAATIAKAIESGGDVYDTSEARTGSNGRRSIPHPTALRTASDDATEGPPHWTDTGNGIRLAQWHGSDLRFVGQRKKWLAWDGMRWTLDATGEVHRRAKAVPSRLFAEALDGMDEIRQELEEQANE
jgi:primase-polymerase (primpol)-like protein